ALGIGVNTAIFTLVNALLLRPVTSVGADRMVGVYSRDRTKAGAYRAFSYPDYVDLRVGSGGFDALMAHNFAMVGLRGGDATRRVFADVVSSNYFATLGVHLSEGRAFSPEEEAPGAGIPVVVVSHGFWKKAGGPADFVGRVVRLNGQDFTVVGIAPEGFSGTMALLSPEVWLPLGMYDATLNDFQRRGGGGGPAGRRAPHPILGGRAKDGGAGAGAGARLRAGGGGRGGSAWPRPTRRRTRTRCSRSRPSRGSASARSRCRAKARPPPPACSWPWPGSSCRSRA